MFDEFRPSTQRREERRRFGGSMAIAAVVYGALALLIVGGSRAAVQKVEEDLVQVKFAAPPPPPPAPEPPPPVAAQPAPTTPRPKARRKELRPPDEIPENKPKESDAPLAEGEPSGPTDGFTDGVEGGTGTGSAPPPPPPPPPKPEPLVQPVAAKDNAPPAMSASARRKGIFGVVVVSFLVLENGTTANAKIVSGPEELRENVLKAVASWRFEPAKRGGKPVRHALTKAIDFRING
ncbi:MAG: TonB family protein [Polyangiales bacterium]